MVVSGVDLLSLRVIKLQAAANQAVLWNPFSISAEILIKNSQRNQMAVVLQMEALHGGIGITHTS